MKVTFFNRPKSAFAYSIEGVFNIIKRHLQNKIELSEYYSTNKWKRMHSVIEAKKFQGDINHITGDAHLLALGLKSDKTILTVHDIAHYERVLKGMKRWFFGLVWLKLPLKHVKVVTTISEFTKQKLLQYVDISPDKIRVIHNPAPEGFDFCPKEFNEQSPKILQIGSGAHKNIYRLIDAITGLNFSLILIRKVDRKIEQLLKDRGIAYRWLSNVSNVELANCYKECDIVFFASEYEGFGVPILEANSIGRPVVTSDITSMPEVAGTGAALVNPYDVNSIRASLVKIRDDEAYREGLILSGRENLRRFSPEVIAQKYLDLYTSVFRGEI